jgi:hypothetical protein
VTDNRSVQGNKKGQSDHGLPFPVQILVSGLVRVTAATAGATTTTTTTSAATTTTSATTSLSVWVLLCLCAATAATSAAATSACAGEVRVRDYKSATLQAIDVINAGTLQKWGTLSVNDDLYVEVLDESVVLGWRLFQSEDVFDAARRTGS